MNSLAKKVEDLDFQHEIVADKSPIKLDCGIEMSNITIAYETYGTLNENKSNAILICHALTGDQFVAGKHPVTGKAGWWEVMVGSGKPIDTDKYFVICTNILGGCMGSTGPLSVNPDTGKPYGLDFPFITIADMARAQKLLIDKLGITQLFAAVGGSMGGAQILELAAHYPDMLKHAVIMAIGPRYSAQNIAFNEVSRQALIADPNWAAGKYLEKNTLPTAGLSVARMSKHITYMSEGALQEKFGRNLQNREEMSFSFEADFQIESYLRYQGISFVDRFDANSYLYLTRSFDYFDLELEHKKPLSEIYKNSPIKFCLMSFSTDWFSPPRETKEIATALNAAGAAVSYVEIEHDRGHDAFLLESPVRDELIRKFFSDGETSTVSHFEKSGKESRADFKMISDLIKDGKSVLDLGCGDGGLLAYLNNVHNIKSSGIELSDEGVQNAVSKGLNVIKGDIEEEIDFYRDDSYDYAILSHTIQAMNDPRGMLQELVRIGKMAIVSLPNFGHWSVRSHLFFKGAMPVTKSLPYSWYNTPNIHFCTLKDFESLCAELNIKILEKKVLDLHGKPCSKSSIAPNLFGLQAVYLLTRN